MAAAEKKGLSAILDETPAPRVHAECVRIARRLRAGQHKIIGFLPAGEDVAVPPVALKIGAALVELSGATVAYVDANVHWPAISSLAGEEDPGDTVFTTRWLKGSLALLTPSASEDAGMVGPQLERLLFDGTELFEYMLVDLTGFALFGEEKLTTAMDAVVLVARAGHTTEKQLLVATERLAGRFLGVLLVG